MPPTNDENGTADTGITGSIDHTTIITTPTPKTTELPMYAAADTFIVLSPIRVLSEPLVIAIQHGDFFGFTEICPLIEACLCTPFLLYCKTIDKQ